MSHLKVADYRIAQHAGSGYVLYKLIQIDGTVSDWIGWKYIPIAELASLQIILSSNNAYYDSETEIFSTGSSIQAMLGNFSEVILLNPEGIEFPLQKSKRKTTRR